MAGNVERYNEQLHPRAAQLIEREAPRLAADKNISQEEATRRMAVALAYYTDEGWNKSIPEKDANIDVDTLAHLGVALAPIADQYARPDTSVDGNPRSYSGNETATMIVDFQTSRPAAYKDSNRNIDYLGDPQGNKTQGLVEFYENNLNFSDKPTDVLESVAGGFAGIGRSAWGMVRATAKVGGELLGGDPLGGVNSLLGPVADSSLDPIGQMTTRQSGRAFVSNLQGNSYESAAQVTEIGTDVASIVVPVGSAGKFGQLAKASEASSLARAENVLIAKSGASVDLAATSRSEALGGISVSGLADDAADFYCLNVSNVDYTSQLERTGTVKADDAFAAKSNDVVLAKYNEPCCLADGEKGIGAAVDDTIKALPAPRQIDASWSASTYKKGGLMTGIEHVFYRHGPDSGFTNVSKFSQGTSVKDVSSYVDNALRYGKVTPNGPSGHIIEYSAGKVIGTSVSGAPTSTIKVNVRDGVIQTAFPY
ncbi:hypothetical protein [Pseudomonas syringae group genomosp. 3]|uniref:hypothetical protein n=1 Tax=Pseudomonas syringae group genomosp. 3 TaxID=251701 RepID=UPI001F2DD60A|nr:hypothetical protein [Pseudomonas syringae group genomosp. 3]